jgi:hypothetical protein
VVQPIDQGLGREVKREIDEVCLEWLEDDVNLALWEEGFGVSDLRVLITQWAGEAWRRVLAGDYVWKYFQRTGCLVTLDGSGDAGIKFQGIEDFKFERPDVPDVPPEWPEPDLPTDADDDQTLAMMHEAPWHEVAESTLGRVAAVQVRPGPQHVLLATSPDAI